MHIKCNPCQNADGGQSTMRLSEALTLSVSLQFQVRLSPPVTVVVLELLVAGGVGDHRVQQHGREEHHREHSQDQTHLGHLGALLGRPHFGRRLEPGLGPRLEP